VKVVVYQILREALLNAVKHAEATRVDVTLSQLDGQMVGQVSDNGRGFDPTTVDSETHFGLGLIRERARLLGGEIKIVSELGAGSQILLRLPTAKPPQ
jgi:signal transduction histidine kinase